MKHLSFLVIVTVLLVASCRKSKVPSLTEQMEGKWRIQSYTRELYNPASNTVTTWNVAGTSNDYVEFFPFERMHVKADSTPLMIWTCKIIDQHTLGIDNRRWSITKLDGKEFHLTLSVRDSTYKTWEAVYFHLTRP